MLELKFSQAFSPKSYCKIYCQKSLLFQSFFCGKDITDIVLAFSTNILNIIPNTCPKSRITPLRKALQHGPYINFKWMCGLYQFQVCFHLLDLLSWSARVEVPFFVQFYAQSFHYKFSIFFRSSPCIAYCNTISMRFDVISRGITLIANPRQFWSVF